MHKKKNYVITVRSFVETSKAAGEGSVLCIVKNKKLALAAMMDNSRVFNLASVLKIKTVKQLEMHIGAENAKHFAFNEDYDEEEPLVNKTYVVYNDDNDQIDVYTIVEICPQPFHGIAYADYNTVHYYNAKESDVEHTETV